MNTTPTWSTLDLDEAVALRTAATRLAARLRGVFGTETIERFLHSSFDQFAGRATVTKFLPLMAERFARQRLRALAKVEGLHDDGKPTVLFLCVHNAGRSQMAMGFFQHLAGDRAVAWSGGSEPGIEVNPAAVAAMAERASTSPASSPSPGPTRPSAPPTWSSPWDAVTPARSSPASATRNGSSTTRPARTSPTSARSATRSNAGSGTCWTACGLHHAEPLRTPRRAEGQAGPTSQAGGREGEGQEYGRGEDRDVPDRVAGETCVGADVLSEVDGVGQRQDVGDEAERGGHGVSRPNSPPLQPACSACSPCWLLRGHCARAVLAGTLWPTRHPPGFRFALRVSLSTDVAGALRPPEPPPWPSRRLRDVVDGPPGVARGRRTP